MEEKEMEYIYSAMLLHSAGKKITAENVKKVLTAAGVKVDDARVKALTASLEGVNIEEAIKTAAVPVAAAPAAKPEAAKGEAPAPAEGKPDEKKEEKKKKEEPEVSEEEAAAGLGALFG
jgi:large subunit ribosomal protein L12